MDNEDLMAKEEVRRRSIERNDLLYGASSVHRQVRTVDGYEHDFDWSTQTMIEVYPKNRIQGVAKNEYVSLQVR